MMTATTTNSNFYQVGASLPVDAPSYVKRQADEVFYQKLREGKFCYVLNSRQMGKSSLRVQTMQRLEKEGTVCAAIDLTGIGKVTQEQWYGGIVYNLSESCQLEDKFDFDWQEWWEKHQSVLSPVQCLGLFIEKVLLAKIEQPIVIFVDEIDKVLSQDFSADDFFGLIRFFQNQRVDNPIFERLTFALLGVATPGDLITNKTQTPFNIGEAIELHGFKFDEVEALIEGLRGKCDRPQVIMKEILDCTGGQPFLTQKLCKFMVEESEKDNPGSVEEVVKSRIIENWESQDDPEHLRTIRDRILSSEQRAGYLLELYQQIQQQGEVAAKKNLEYSELRLSGLVVQREGKLRVYNRVYQRVFNQNWVEVQLKNLRPYSEAFRAWVNSGYSDESRLLRGKALSGAERWAKGKDLSFQDKQFLAASREKEIQEKIAVEQQEAELERERKDREAAEKRNLVLSEANRKAKQRIRNGTVVLVLALLGAVSLGGFAAREGNKAFEAQQTAENARKQAQTQQQIAEQAQKNADYAEKEVQTARKQAQTEQQKAQVAQKTANDAQRVAQTAKKQARLAQKTTDKAKLEAETARKQAQTEQKKSQIAQKDANKANQIAETAKKQAQTEQQKAQIAQKAADEATQLAQKAKKQAQTEQQKAQVAQKTANDAQRVAQTAQQQARLAQLTADKAKLEAQNARKQAQTEQRKAQIAQKIANDATYKLEQTKEEIKNVSFLSYLGSKLYRRNKRLAGEKAWKQASLSFEIPSNKLKQAMLLNNISIAHQELSEFSKAYQAVSKSLKLLQTDVDKKYSRDQLILLAQATHIKGDLLEARGDIQKASNAYTQAFTILQLLGTNLNNINPAIQVSLSDIIESGYRGKISTFFNQPLSQQNLEKVRQLAESLYLTQIYNYRQIIINDTNFVKIDQIDSQAAVIYPIVLENSLEVILHLPGQKLEHHNISIPKAKLENFIGRLRENIVQPDKLNSFRLISYQMYNWLIKPIEPNLIANEVKTLVFVTDSEFAHIPMASLYDAVEGKYLIEKYAIAFTPSLQIVKPQPYVKRPLKALIAGIEKRVRVLIDNKTFLPNIATTQEIRNIQQNLGFSSRILYGDHFTIEALKKAINLSSISIVHFATHAEFSSNSNETYILASDKLIKASDLDDLLKSREQKQTEPIELLVFSSSETALGDKNALLGLKRFAVTGGVKSTLASLWMINDSMRSSFMNEFYSRFTTGQVTKAEALRQAQLKILMREDRPYFWAPYVLIGNWF